MTKKNILTFFILSFWGVLLGVSVFSVIRIQERTTYQQPTPLPTPSPIAKEPERDVLGATTSARLFLLHIAAEDYGTGTSLGSITGANVRVYQSPNWSFIDNRTISESKDTKDYAIATFPVPLGTFRVEAETKQLHGKTDITIRNFGDQAYYTLKLYAKPMTIVGKYFIDTNKNGIFDNGDTPIANQPVTAWRQEKNWQYTSLGGAGETNDQGDFAIRIEGYKGTYQLQTPDLPNSTLKQKPLVKLIGGDIKEVNLIRRMTQE